MAFYLKKGKLPPKRHITFYKPDGKSLYREELFSSKGFSSIYSNKYHVHEPTKILNIKEIKPSLDKVWADAPLQHYHFFTDEISGFGDHFTSRKSFLQNAHCRISTARPDANPDYFYKNAYAHEYIFIHKGEGEFLSEYGKIGFEKGDQIVVPKSVIYRLNFSSKENKLLIVESDTPFDIPKHYRNEYGQLLEEAPFSERDFKTPEFCEPRDETGEFKILIKAGERLYEHTVPNHPFDLVGWDGFLYPYAFNIANFDPKVGRIHLPPPVHLLFTTQNFVLCNFVPRLFDFHPQAIPAPYFHSNVDSDEVLYYVEGNFMSRKGIKEGSMTLHPMGVPHGPQPGKTEESVGAKETHEYAVMIDTFSPLQPTENVEKTMQKEYYKSWLT